MWILAFAIIAASALGDEPGPAELVKLLGSADRVEREEAALTLEERGAAALPALHDAEKAGPGDVRSKAASLARSIEGRQLDRPSLVAIDFNGQPLEEAIRTLAARSGYAIRLKAGDDAALPRRPIVARAPAPVPFWEALDLIGRAGHVRLYPAADPRDLTGGPVLRVADGEPPARTLYRGAFRVNLVGLHRRRDRDLGSSPGREPSTRDVLYVDLQAFAEPGRFLDLDGRPRIEVEDDRGRPLPPAPAGAQGPGVAPPSWSFPDAIEVLQWRLPLGPPDQQATKLGRLKGTLPVLVSAARPDPLVIALDDAPGRSYHHAGMTLRYRIMVDSAEHMQVEVILSRDPGPAGSRDDRAWGARRHRFVFEDRDGHRLSWHPMFDIAGTGKETRIGMMISRGRPVRLRFHDLAWSVTEIPFEFTDVPLP